MEIIEINIEGDYRDKMPIQRGNTDGIAYAMYLRRVEKIKSPILFRSTNELATVLKYPNSNIINAIGHSFYQITKPDLYDNSIKELHPLNDIQLSDIIINYCGVRSALSNTFHEFKNDIKAIKNKELIVKEKVTEINKVVEKYKDILIREYPDNSRLLSEYNRITGLFSNQDLTTIDYLLIDDKSLAITIPTEEEDVPKELVQYSWEVLLLDDNLLEIDDVIKEIERTAVLFPDKLIKHI